MTRIGMGLVGPGFVGAHHIDAVRRLGFVDVVAIAASTEASARRKADELGVPKAYGSYEALVADPDVHVVHNTTPNYLHVPVILAALARRKHVISDKPLAMTSADARRLLDAANGAGVVHAVTFNYRGNPLVQQAREMVAGGELGRLHFIHGAYLQDWLLEETDFSWRLEPEKGGLSSAVADIGTHWCDLVQHVAGQRIVEVLADLTTVVDTRLKPAGIDRRVCARGGRRARVGGGAQRRSGDHPRALRRRRERLCLGRPGLRRPQERPVVRDERPPRLAALAPGASERAVDRAPRRAERHARQGSALLTPGARAYAHLPGGHQEGWADAFCNVLRDVYGFIVSGKLPGDPRPPAFATFEDGYHAACVVDAILDSHRRGGVWTKVSALTAAEAAR